MHNAEMVTEIFVAIDDFCQIFVPELERRMVAAGTPRSHAGRPSALCESEIMTVVIFFHLSGMRNFKYFYQLFCKEFSKEFPNLVSYQRMVELMKSVTMHIYAFILHNVGECTGISFVDSTKIQVCGSKRIRSNKVFSGLARIGKSTMGWFFGFKLHLVINDKGEILSFHITQGNTDDRDPLPLLFRNISGKVFADKGYISQELFELFMGKGVQLITTLKKRMKPKLVPLIDKILLRKRSIIETVNDFLKNICQIEHTRHRAPHNFFVNLLAGLAAYSFLPKKPSIRVDLPHDLNDSELALCEGVY
jgi:hypothetical protein